jgi:anti-anti-sigma factor
VDEARDAVEQALGRARDGEGESIVVDIDALEFIDSTGLTLLLELSRRENGPASLRFTRGTGHVAEMLRLTGLDQSLPVA